MTTKNEENFLAFAAAFIPLCVVGALLALVLHAADRASHPAPVPAPVVDETREAVYLELAPRLHGTGDRPLPPQVARAITDAVVDEARVHGFSPWLVVALIEVESGGNVDAVSPCNARGLMQLLPSTFAAMNRGYSVHDPVQNVRAGVAYLAYLYKGGEGFVRLDSLLRAYNGGPGAAMRYTSSGGEGNHPEEMLSYPGKVRKRLHVLTDRNPDKAWRL